MFIALVVWLMSGDYHFSGEDSLKYHYQIACTVQVGDRNTTYVYDAKRFYASDGLTSFTDTVSQKHHVFNRVPCVAEQKDNR